MSQSSSPSAVLVMMSSLPPPSALLLPSALRAKKRPAATSEGKASHTVTFSQQPQHNSANQFSTAKTAPDHHESKETSKAQQQHVQEMLLRLQRQAERAMKIDRHAQGAHDKFEGFPRIPAHCDELDEDDSVTDADTDERSSDDGSCSSSSSCGEATDEEEEDRIVKELVEHAFRSRKRAAPGGGVPSVVSASSDSSSVASSQSRADLPSLNPFKRQRLQVQAGAAAALPCPREVASDAFRTYARSRSGSMQQPSRGLSFSLSEPNLVGRFPPAEQAKVKSEEGAPPSSTPTSPHEYLRRMHEEAGVPFAVRPAWSISDFFVKGDPNEYDMTVVQAVRSGNLDLLRELKQNHGRDLQCCNKFGESIVHTVARHGLASVLELLLELDVSVRVCCDSGRSPLSDACWTQVPVAEQRPSASHHHYPRGVVDLLLDECPDLLYVTDQRGLSPLSYVPREHWEAWCRYLQGRGLNRLRPKDLPSSSSPPRGAVVG